MNQATAKRFWSKTVVSEGGCVLWTAAKNAGGYGTFTINNHGRLAHRLAYELLVGPIPDGLQLDHLCRVRHCVSPAHLEPVTSGENTRRGLAPLMSAMRERAKTRCPAGHEFDAENTYPDSRGWRGCRECRNEAGRRYRARKAALRAADKMREGAHGDESVDWEQAAVLIQAKCEAR